MKIPCLLLLAVAATLSLGEAKEDDRSLTLASPKSMLRRALEARLITDKAPLRLRGSRQLEDKEEENQEEGEQDNEEENQDQEDEQQQQEEDDEDEQEEEDNHDNDDGNEDGHNNHDDDDAIQYYDDAYEEEPDHHDMTLIERFNSMSRSSKIWTLVLTIWGFIVLFACLIMCVRGCTEQQRKESSYRSRKQPLMSSSVASGNTEDSNGRGRSRKGWWARMGERNREIVGRRRSQSGTRTRGRNRSRSRGRN